MQDLIGGRIDFLCDLAVTAVPAIKGGTVKGLATLAAGAWRCCPICRPPRKRLAVASGLHLDRVVSCRRARRKRLQPS
jgi:hypothetical protein